MMCVKIVTEFLVAFSNYIWPIVLISVALIYKGHISSLFGFIKQQISMGATFKYGEISLIGTKIENFPLATGSEFDRVRADKKALESRDGVYKRNKNIFLVHRVRKNGEIHQGTGLPIYDLSIYLITHKNYGALNDVKQVTYYLGKYFGASLSQYGAKFIVRNSNDGFAIRSTAYGPTLCEAVIEFHDGTDARIDRYLDFEGTGYRFDPNVNAHDAGLKK